MLVAAMAASCSSPTIDPATFTLAPGQSVTYGALTIRFISVLSDSRCPGDAICIQPGDAQAQITVTMRGRTVDYTLRVNDPDQRRVVHGDYAIELNTLDPYPFVSRPIAISDYRITIGVRIH
jgi:hypothetical protein